MWFVLFAEAVESCWQRRDCAVSERHSRRCSTGCLSTANGARPLHCTRCHGGRRTVRSVINNNVDNNVSTSGKQFTT